MDPFRVVEEPGARAARRAQFARFHDDNHPQLVALLHALRGDRAHANRAAQRAFVHAWRRWRTVRALPDPAGWTRRRARRLRPPRRRGPGVAVQAHEPEWIAASARPMFDALSRLPEQQRTVVALHHVGGLTLAQVADDEHLPLEAVTARLASGYQALARWMGQTSLAPGNQGTVDPVQSWAAVELAELAHALSYRTDRRAVDQVFRHAIRHRVAVTAATAAAVSIGLGGALVVTQRAARPYDVALPPASAPGTYPAYPAYPGDAHAGPPPPMLGPLSVPGLLPGRQPTPGQDNGPVPTSSVTTLDLVDESTTRRAPGTAPRPDSAEPGHPAAASPESTQVRTRDQPTAMSTPQPSSAGRGSLGKTDSGASASRSAGDSNSGGRGGGRGGGHASGHSSGEGGYSSRRSSDDGNHSGGGHSSSSRSGGGHSSDNHSRGGNSGGGGHSGGGNSGGGQSGGGGRGR